MGKVYLIGAGPGDPELMTLKAARALRSADVILIDELVSRGCLAHARSDARVIEVGKREGPALVVVGEVARFARAQKPGLEKAA